MKPKKKVISWKEIADLQRAGVPPYIEFPDARCENCGHALERHYNYNPSPRHNPKESYGHAVQRVRCSNGKCKCPGIKIQGKLIDEFDVGVGKEEDNGE